MGLHISGEERPAGVKLAPVPVPAVPALLTRRRPAPVTVADFGEAWTVSDSGGSDDSVGVSPDA